MQERAFLAVDLGATSGRTIVGKLINGRIDLRPLTRFKNPIVETCGHHYWDICHIYGEIVNGLKAAHSQKIPIESVGIDTWGIDFTCIGKDGEILRNPYSYRDPHTNGASEDFFKMIPRREVYDLTGIQVMDMNSLYQMHVLNRRKAPSFVNADKILFMPDALSYLLTGNMVTEYTIASTSQIMNARTKDFDRKLMSAVGLDASKFAKFVMPGHSIGVLNKTVQKLTGLGPVPVIAVAGHDTASAVAAVPAADKNFAYISSGTWSLMGIETAKSIVNDESYAKNFTNEGGIEGTTRFLKNICGMWLLERCRAEWGEERYSYDELHSATKKASAFQSIINPDAPVFANPPSMIHAIQEFCKATKQHIPVDIGDITRCIYDSLALRYRQVFEDLKALSPHKIERVHVIGGGSQNEFLNQQTANSIGVPVLAGPVEATALGNVLVQAKACGAISDIREIARKSVQTHQFVPRDQQIWDNAYEKYLKVMKL